MNRRARGLEHRKSFVDAAGHLGVEAGAIVLGDAADAQAGERLVEQLRVARHRVRERRCIAGVVACDRLHDERTVGSGAGHRAHLVEARSKGHEATTADSPIRRLEAGDAAEARRLPDRAPCVRSDGDRRHVGGHARRGATARTARRPGKIPRIVNGAERRVFVGAPHRKLVHVRLANDHRIGAAKPRNHLGVVGRPIAGEHLGCAGRGEVGGAERILDRDRKAGERANRFSSGTASVDVGRLGERSLTIHCQERVDLAIESVDPVEKRGHALNGGDVSALHGVHNLGGGAFEKLHGVA